jgi:hypothetical protein
MTKSDSAETLSFVLIESSTLMIGVELSDYPRWRASMPLRGLNSFTGCFN